MVDHRAVRISRILVVNVQCTPNLLSVEAITEVHSVSGF